jgi:predicted DNA-binding transcriptional regulator AlpA
MFVPEIPKDQRSSYDRMLADVPRRRKRRRASTHRQQDRGADGDDDGEDDDVEPAKVFRFRDLKALGIVSNWVTLQTWIRDQNFPPGFLLGQNTRAWFAADIMHWLKTRPVERTTQKRQHESAGA